MIFMLLFFDATKFRSGKETAVAGSAIVVVKTKVAINLNRR